jgi:HSP20 family molecular chaperone IbpA
VGDAFPISGDDTPTVDPMSPAVDVYEDDNGISLWADMPGVPKDQVAVHIQDNALTIAGTMSLGAPDAMQPIHAEITSPRYQRVFTLSRDLDADKVQASFDAGVLHLRIPKMMQERPKRIEVRVN